MVAKYSLTTIVFMVPSSLLAPRSASLAFLGAQTLVRTLFFFLTRRNDLDWAFVHCLGERESAE